MRVARDKYEKSNEIIVAKMTNEERKTQIEKTQNAIKCGMFTSLGDFEGVDDKIIHAYTVKPAEQL